MVTSRVALIASLCIGSLALCQCGSGSSKSTSTVSGPAVPSSVKASPADGQVTLTWSGTQGDTFHVYWDTQPGVRKSVDTRIAGVTSPFVHDGLENGQTYYYIVTAVRGDQESAESVEVFASPFAGALAPPGGFTATAGDGQVTLAWQPVVGATSYNVYWSEAAGVTSETGDRLTDVTAPHVHGGLTNGKTYHYVVTAVGPAGESAESEERSATPAAGVPAPEQPPAPQHLAAAGGCGQITVTWDPVPGASVYNVYWSPTAGAGTGGNKVTTTSSPLVQQPLPPATERHFVVTAVRDGLESAPSTEAVAVTGGVAAPIGLYGSARYSDAGAAEAWLSWTGPADATSYHLYWRTSPGVSRANGNPITGASPGHVFPGSYGATYYLVVTALGACGESAESAEATVTMLGTELSPPPFVQASCTPHVGPSWTFDVTSGTPNYAKSREVWLQPWGGSLWAYNGTSSSYDTSTCDGYIRFAVVATACADTPATCPVKSTTVESDWVPFCVDAPTLIGFDGTWHNVEWTPTPGAEGYQVCYCDVYAHDCGDMSFWACESRSAKCGATCLHTLVGPAQGMAIRIDVLATNCFTWRASTNFLLVTF